MNVRLLSILIVVGLSPALADVTDEVRCREIGFSLAAERQDLDDFRSFIDADARFVGGTVLRGVEDVTAAWAVFFQDDGPVIQWRPQIIEVLENGKLALSRGPYRTLSRDAEGNIIEQWGTFNSVWRLNADGQWRVVFDAGSPAATEPDATTKALLAAENDCPR